MASTPPAEAPPAHPKSFTPKAIGQLVDTLPSRRSARCLPEYAARRR